MYCRKQVTMCHGSRASRLEIMNIPYVAKRDTTMREKIGEPMFLAACIMQSTPQTNMLEALASIRTITHYRVRMAKM